MLTRMYNYWNAEEYELAVEGQAFLETKLSKLKENLDDNNLVLKKIGNLLLKANKTADKLLPITISLYSRMIVADFAGATVSTLFLFFYFL